MASFNVTGSETGESLRVILMSKDIKPGDSPGYELCKLLYLYHPLGEKMASAPTRLAQSQRREISIPDAPEEIVAEAFNREWDALDCDRYAANIKTLSRVYGVSTLALGVVGQDSHLPIEAEKLWQQDIYFSVFDPLNTAGSLITNQNPNSPDFQKTGDVRVQSEIYHRSKCCIVINEDPIYLAYTDSSFGYTGRSVYQRALYPMKSFVKTMIADDIVATKCSLIVAMIKQVGSTVDRLMQMATGRKRNLLKEAENDNVISIDVGEDIKTLDMNNVNSALEMTRNNILKNIAMSAPMPSRLLNDESFVDGFSEGNEDAKNLAHYIERYRGELRLIYSFLDNIVMYRAWNPEFYATIQAKFPKYKSIDYKTAFAQWKSSFVASWPSLLTEPDSEKIKVDDIKMKAIIAMLEVLMPQMAGDPDNTAIILQWAQDNFNENKLLFQNPLLLDFEALKSTLEEKKQQADETAKAAMQAGQADPESEGETEQKEPTEPKPFAVAA